MYIMGKLSKYTVGVMLRDYEGGKEINTGAVPPDLYKGCQP